MQILIADAMRGGDQSEQAIRVLNIILRQHAAKLGCLLVRQSFFPNHPSYFIELGGGFLGCRGFHSSFRPTKSGLYLNFDVSTTMIVKPGPVIEFLLANQNVDSIKSIDWVEAKRTLKNLRIRNINSNVEHKITGLSEKSCIEQKFWYKPRKDDVNLKDPVEFTVHDYFVGMRGMTLVYSENLPCINVGKPNRPIFIPIEHCELVSLQRYTKALTNLQRDSLVEKSRQKPQDRIRILNEAYQISNYNADPLLRSCGVTISDDFSLVKGRVLSAPQLRVGNGENFVPQNGRWNFNNKKLVEPVGIGLWAAVNFSTRIDIQKLVRVLTRCGRMKGLTLLPPEYVVDEEPQFRHATAPKRVERMFELLMQKLPGLPEFLLCILPERKNSALYGPWKKTSLTVHGIVTQCVAPNKINDQYVTNVVLKINAKMGGLNWSLSGEAEKLPPVVSRENTLIVGMDVSHGSPGRADVPSIAAVVGSRGWPSISKYVAYVRTQSPNSEIIDSLYNKNVKGKDVGIFRKLLVRYYKRNNQQKPEHIIIFRDGVGESQFYQVLNIEFEQIIQACKNLDEFWHPKFTLLVAQKNHHTRFFQVNSTDNVPPGTVVDDKICHPRNNDFYMCAHAGMTGTSRPMHYHVLHDEIGFSADDVQELVNSLSYVCQRSSTAISVVAPIYYAHLAASQVSQFVKFHELSETASIHDGATSSSGGAIPKLPKLKKNVRETMFFC